MQIGCCIDNEEEEEEGMHHAIYADGRHHHAAQMQKMRINCLYIPFAITELVLLLHLRSFFFVPFLVLVRSYFSFCRSSLFFVRCSFSSFPFLSFSIPVCVIVRMSLNTKNKIIYPLEFGNCACCKTFGNYVLLEFY